MGSTRGSSLQPILYAIQDGRLNAEISVVISNVSTSYILQVQISVVSSNATDISSHSQRLHLLHPPGTQFTCFTSYKSTNTDS